MDEIAVIRRRSERGSTVSIAQVASNIGKGLVAGVVGTAAMTVSSTIEMRLAGRGPSDAPVTAASRVLGIDAFATPEATERFGNLVHWAYGTGWGAVRGVLGTVTSPGRADLAHGAFVLGGEHVMLPGLDIAPPVTQWDLRTIAIDALHHSVYVAATALAFRWLDRSDKAPGERPARHSLRVEGPEDG